MPFPNGHNIAALDRGNAQADGRLAVVAEYAARRIFIAPLESRDILEKELAARAIGADGQVEHVVGGGELAGWIERNVFVSDPDASAIGGYILGLKLPVYLVFVDA